VAQLNRVAVIGNSLPRRCGIATFTSDLAHAIATSHAAPDTCIVAMTDNGHAYDYPPNVRFQVADDKIEDYAHAANFLNAGKYDVVSLQHEFGIFGGEAGGYILALLSRLTMPVVTTFHTILRTPSKAQHSVMLGIVEASSKVVVMAEKARELLRTIYRVPPEKIDVIPHGIPDCAFVESDIAKAKLGFSGKTVILTFGLLSPNKGIEVVIDAMPSILESRSDAVYVVLGATHPNLVRSQGEDYRESLVARAASLGVQDHVVFLDGFVDLPTLLDYISMCDVYATPYLNEAQMTSGTLSYSFGLGKAVVSTPYWHARELLANGHGILVPFGDSKAIGEEISGLLADETWRNTLRKRAYSSSRAMTWERTAECYLTTFASAQRKQRLRAIAWPGTTALPANIRVTPDLRTAHLMSMCDDTGILQHAIHSVPDRLHGYCVDDNARALILACALNKEGEQALPEVLTSRLAAFVQHAWNPDTRRFRNFMSFNRTWLEDRGSEDSQGRTLWSLGVCAAGDSNRSRRKWAASLFSESLPLVESLGSPRAWAFALLGLDAYFASGVVDPAADRIRYLLVDRLMAIMSAVETKNWVWFENGLGYDNARLPEALIATGVSTCAPVPVIAGLRALRWLMTIQTTPEGLFRPVGSDSFGELRKLPRAFDQQPLEAAATISACRAAWRADGNPEWKADAARAFAWFMGGNDLSAPLADPETGACRDGLHPDRANENRGAESTLSYLLALADMRQLARSSEERLEQRAGVARRA
jgi:glycosyltransferase involved in cell wall biosynthesis